MNGDIIPIKQFIEDCENGLLTDYDGYGFFYSIITGENRATAIYQSDVIKWKTIPNYKYIEWFNK